MAGFMGRESVVRARDLKRDYGGKLVGGTLKRRSSGDTFVDVTWSNLYVQPITEYGPEETGAGSAQRMRITAYRLGEAYAPRAGNKWSIGGVTYEILTVSARLNADESLNYAVYDTECSRMA